jgi:hypothetical protein
LQEAVVMYVIKPGMGADSAVLTLELPAVLPPETSMKPATF